MRQPIRVFIIDDHKIVREGLRIILESKAGIVFAGEASNGREALQQLRKTDVDVVLMDVSMPELNGFETTSRLLEQSPELRVIGLSMHKDKQFILEMFRAGASGYLLKDCASEELIQAIRTVFARQIFLSSNIRGIHAPDLPTRNDRRNATEETLLSSREKEVLQLIAEGHGTREIGKILFVSPKTVESHRRNIMEKLKMKTIPALTKYAIKTGLTSLDQ